ncbi:MAG: Ig-like domain-containing protein [Pirellulaceae bacterium]
MTAPVASPTAGSLFQLDIGHPEEGNGLRYTLSNAPTGMTINNETGVVSWTPTASQVGDRSYTVITTDLAGNSRNNALNVNVGEEVTATLELSISDLNGNAITQLQPGDEFLLNVTAIDNRLFETLKGVAAAYLDIIYDATLAEPVGTNLTVIPESTAEEFANSPFTFTNAFASLRQGSATTPGLLNEVGAFSTNPPGLESGLVSIQMRALKAGNLVFTADPAEGDGTEVLVHGNNDELLASKVNFGNTAINVVASFSVEDDVFNFDEDSTANAMDVLDNDEALASGTTLKIVSTGTTANGGTVAIVGNGASLTYTPAANFNGADEFTYTVEDQNGARQTATVTVGVQPVNDAPTAKNDTFNDMKRGSSLNVLQVLENDETAPDTNETLRVISVGARSNGGTVTIASSGTHLLYTPATGFSGTETFTYTISDRQTGGLTSTATVTVNVSALNTGTHSFTVVEDAAQATFDVLPGDRAANPDETDIFLDAIVSTSNNGTAAITSDGKVQYRPAANFNGTETVEYNIRNNDGDSGRGTITFTVTSVNDPPVATNDSISIAKSQTGKSFTLLDNDTIGVDANETLKIVSVSTANLTGTVTISSDGQSITYTPNGTFTGTETFTYTIEDNNGGQATATVSVEVLDFVPRDFVFNLNSAASRILGLEVMLVGTDDFGNAVEEMIRVGEEGTFRFEDQAPGSYKLRVPQVPFLIGGDQMREFDISSETDDGDITLPTIELGALKPEYIAVRDWFAHTPRTSVVLAAVSNGKSAVFNMEVGALEQGLTDPEVSLNEAGTEVTITATGSSGRVQSKMNVNANQSVDLRGQSGDFKLIRVKAPAASAFTPVTTTTSGQQGAASALFVDPASDSAATQASSSSVVLPLGSGDVWSQNTQASPSIDGFPIDDDDDENNDSEAANHAVFADLDSVL